MTLATPSDIDASAQVGDVIELRLIGDEGVIDSEGEKGARAQFEDYSLPTA